MNEINGQLENHTYPFTKEDWYIEQTERWKVLQQKWRFYCPPKKIGFIGIGMANGKTEAQFYVLFTVSVEQIHSTLLLLCGLFDVQNKG